MSKIKNVKFRTYLLIIIGVVIVTLIGISFAYFSATVTNDASADVTVTLPDQASLTFSKSGDLLIDATMSNFAEDKGNLSESSTSSVKLVASGDYVANYYVYFEILSNDFEYTTDDETAELLLVIEDSNGDPVISVSGLSYVTTDDDDISGFDITTKTGLFTISGAETISLSNGNTEATESYTFTLYFINLDTNQNANTGKTFESQILMQAEGYTETILLSEQILMDEGDGYDSVDAAKLAISAKIEPTFSSIATDDEGIFETEDNYTSTTEEMSYYFRGAIEDNYVEFAGMLWRIIRIDGNGNIKLMLYNDEQATDGTWEGTSYKEYGITGSYDVYFNNTTYTADYNAGTGSNDAKTVVEKWYNDYLAGYSSDLVATNYCVDMESQSYSSTYEIYYGAFDRLVGQSFSSSNATGPSLECDTTKTGVYEYSYSVGLISADEVSFAGGVYVSSNSSYYLNTGYNYWSGSAFSLYRDAGYSFFVTSPGILGDCDVAVKNTVFPAVSLSSFTQFTEGEGSIQNPYVVS